MLFLAGCGTYRMSAFLGRYMRQFALCSIEVVPYNIYHFPDTHMYRILDILCRIKWKNGNLYMLHGNDQQIPVGRFVDILTGMFLERVDKHIYMCNGQDWENAAHDGQIIHELFTS